MCNRAARGASNNTAQAFRMSNVLQRIVSACMSGCLAAFALAVAMVYCEGSAATPTGAAPETGPGNGTAQRSRRDACIRKVARRLKANVQGIRSTPPRVFFVRNPLVMEYLTNEQARDFPRRVKHKKWREFKEEGMGVSGRRRERHDHRALGRSLLYCAGQFELGGG